MRSKTKIVLASVLVLGSVGIWMPQIYRFPDEETPVPRGEVAADGAVSPAPFAAGAAAVPGPREETAAPAAAGTDPAGVLGELERTLSMLGNFAPRAGRPDLTPLLAARAGVAESDEGPAANVPPVVPPVFPVLEGESSLALLEEFVAANELSGMIYGDDRSLALLGHRVVAEGDRLAHGRIRVLAIGPGWLQLGCGEREEVVDLPPFTAREGNLSAGEAAGAEAPAAAEGETAPPAGGGAAGPEPGA
ncbi:MAG: hypothetical protein AB1726_04700 [Planctomycetota bacterium]